MDTIFKNLILTKAPKGNVIDGCTYRHYDVSDSEKSFLHTQSQGAIIIGALVQAAIEMARTNVSIGRVNDTMLYIECLMPNGNVCSLLYDEETQTLRYEYDEDFESSDNVWPLATLLLHLAMSESGASELVDAYSMIQKQVVGNQTVNSGAFILCDYMVCRNTSKKRIPIDIKMDDVEKVRNINITINGEPLSLVQDLTKKYTGKDGAFERVVFASDTTTKKEKEPMLGLNKFLLGEELTPTETMLIPNITGVVERPEYVRTLQHFYNHKDLAHPHNNICAPGGTGAGKSFFASVMASEFGLPYVSVAGNEEFSETMLKGMWKNNEKGETVFERSPLAKWFERPCVIEFAEATAIPPTILTSIYDLMDRDKQMLLLEDGTIVRRHPHCYFIFTYNTYKSMFSIANSLQRRSHRTLRLTMMGKNDLAKVIIRECDGKHIDDDILNNVLDCMEQIEDFLKTAPRGCETSMSTYASWCAAIQDSRDCDCYNPIEEARATILPMLSCGANYSEELEQEIVDTIITPTFNFVEEGGM